MNFGRNSDDEAPKGEFWALWISLSYVILSFFVQLVIVLQSIVMKGM